MEKSTNYFRTFAIMTGFVIAIMVVYVIVLMRLQFVEGDTYKDKAVQYTATSLSLTAARGEIVDRYGRPIAKNRMGYNIIFNYAEMKRDDYNNIIWQLTRVLKEDGEEWIDNCPIIIDASGYASFEEDREKEISKMKASLNLQQTYATAQNCLDTMKEEYKVGELDAVTARTIMGVRLNMSEMSFSSSNPYVFAEDVSLKTVQKVMENSEVLKGVEVVVMPIREYADGTIAPHLVGNTGPIYAEEYEELKKQGYKITAKIGKFGVEKTYESYLKGTDGVKKIQRDDNGEIVYEEVTKDAVPGNTLVLTIDSELQKVAQDSLGTLIKSIAASGRASGRERNGADADAGACVVMNCRTFEVLAAVTYPSYDLSSYNEKYSDLLKDKSAPLYNRVLNGTYAPGSTFKPAVALAGLQEKEISKDEIIQCVPSAKARKHNVGAFVLSEYNNFALYCLHVHNGLNVTRAIGVSCNVFFYTVGYRLGITRMNDYCKQLGLGVATGIGMGESKGVLAGHEEREAKQESWYAADTLTAAIGQNDNQFTPLQMAAYMSTIANGGTRYEARLIKTIKSYDMKDTIIEDTADNPVVYNKLNVDSVMISVVKEGMRKVTEDGTAAQIFGNYPVAVGGKTGTADTLKTATANAVFIAFAPYEEPEIAVAIIGERCGAGSRMANVAKDIFDYYFFAEQTDGNVVLPEGALVE